MDWIGITGIVGLGGLAASLLAFAASSVVEREPRAAVVAAAFGVVLGVVAAVLVLGDGVLRDAALLALVGAEAAGVLLLLLPGRTGRAVPQPEFAQLRRCDERDAVFHRFRRLEPGSDEYERYYADRPDLAAADERIRALPGILMPGSRSYDPAASAFAEAAFHVSADIAATADEVAETLPDDPPDWSAAEMAERLKGLARHLGAGIVGCARLDPSFVYSHIGRGAGEWGAPIELDHGWAIVIGVEMRWSLLRHAPAPAATVETAARYLEAASIASVLARALQKWGYAARAHVDTNYRVLCVPVAAAAGLGEVGRNGLLVAPRLGPRLRLAVVTTDRELASDGPVDLGVQDFCHICRKCATNCPPGAIDADSRRDHGGAEKWQTDRDRCYRFWRAHGTDCGLCVRVCPYAKPATLPHNLVRWLVRRNRFARRAALWADDLFYGRRPRTRGGLPEWLRR